MKRLNLACLCMIFFSLTATPAYALDLQQAYQAAIANDPTYLAAVAQKEATDTQKKQAFSALMPTLMLSGSLMYTREKFLNLDKTTVTTRPGNVALTLSQPIFEMDKLTAYKQVDLNVAKGAMELAEAKQDLILRVLQAYFNVLLTDRNSSIADEQEKNAELQLKMVKRSFDVGSTTVIDINEAESAYYNAKSAAITARSNADNSRSALEDIMGRPIAKDEKLSTLNAPLHLKMPVPGTQATWVARAEEDSYSVRIAKIGYRIAELDVSRINQQHLPTVSLTASQTIKSTNFQRFNDLKSNYSKFGLEVSMPIFDGGLINAQVKEAEALKTKSYQSVRAVETQVAQATRSAYSQATSGLASIEALRSAQKSAAASVRSNIVGRDLGIRITYDVLSAQQIHAQTQYNLAQAQYNTVLGNVNLKAAIGELGDDDVSYINALLTPDTESTGNPIVPLSETSKQSLAVNHVDEPIRTDKTISVVGKVLP